MEKVQLAGGDPWGSGEHVRRASLGEEAREEGGN